MKTELAKKIHKKFTRDQLLRIAKKQGKTPPRGVSKNKLSCMAASNKKCSCK